MAWIRTSASSLAILIGVSAFVGCGGSGSGPAAADPAVADYEALLALFPANDPGSGRDVFTAGSTEQPETLAYVLKAEAIFGRSSPRSRTCIARLLALADQDGDGIAGWGIDQAWDAFGDGTVNPRSQVYLVSNAIVLDGLLAALQANIVDGDQMSAVQNAITQATVSSMGAFTEEASGGFFWYSTAPSDALNVPNVNAYVAGMAQKAVSLRPAWFLSAEREMIRNRVNRAVMTLLSKARVAPDGLPYWAYLDENYASPNDLVHHGYTVLGLWGYQTYGGDVPVPYSASTLADSLLVFLRDGQPTEYPQNRPDLDPVLRDKPVRVWATGFTLDLLTVLGRAQDATPFIESLKRDFGAFPDVRYTPLASTPPPADVFYPRIAAHCLPGLARRATGSSLH